MNKAPDAFRTISEVADHLETPAHVLRFWETRFPQVKPVKGAGGRRYYRPSDVALLAGIRRLLHTDGMTIRGVQKILRDQGVRHVAELGGETLPETESLPEALEALLPPARAEAEIVPLHPGLKPAEALASEEPALSDPGPDGAGPMPPEDGAQDDWAPEELAPDHLAPEPSAAGDLAPGALESEPPVPGDAVFADSEPPEAPPEAPPTGSAPLVPGVGGFALDLDVPRAGEGGFIAFQGPGKPAPPARPEGFVHPDARPKDRAPDRQPSLFDLDDEAPHVFVEDDDSVFELAAFPPPDTPETDKGDADADQGGADADDPGFALAAEDLPSAEAAIQALLSESQDSPAPEAHSPETAMPDPAEPLNAAGDPRPEDRPPLPQLAGLGPRLRSLALPQGDRLMALADLQARLGLLHAQMAEASARPRRNPGE